jgi:hypothetical protein
LPGLEIIALEIIALEIIALEIIAGLRWIIFIDIGSDPKFAGFK